jgi:molybdopterin-guanine dinucleotide biosynthesis protein A
MGRNKALLPLPGAHVTFVEQLASLLSPRCSEVMLVARDAGQATDYSALPVRIVNDRVSNVGPLMGLYSALSLTQTSHALLTAVDMPYISPAMLDFLLSQPRDDALLIPRVDDAPQVLFAIYPRLILPIVESCLQQGYRGPRFLLERVPVRYLEEARLREVDPSLRSFANVNTPEEYARCARAEPI